MKLKPTFLKEDIAAVVIAAAMPDSDSEPTSGSHLATEAEPSVGDNIVKVIQKCVGFHCFYNVLQEDFQENPGCTATDFPCPTSAK